MQLVIHVVSLNPEVSADIAAMIASSAALSISGIPFNGPIGAARVGYINGEYVLNPSITELADSKMDLIVAGTETAVLMVESEADQLSEDVMLGGVVFGHEQGNIGKLQPRTKISSPRLVPWLKKSSALLTKSAPSKLVHKPPVQPMLT